MTFEQFRDEAFETALSLGCTAAETYYVQDNAFQAQALDGELENYTVSQTGGLGLRVQFDGHNGYAYTEQLDGVRQLVERAIACGADKVQFDREHIDVAAVEKAHAHGIVCNLFYSDDREDAKRFLDMGVDTILTNELLTVQPTKNI